MTPPDSQSRPKIIDLRFVVDMIFARYYVVLLVGKDQRTQPRLMKGVNRFLNLVTAIALLLGLNILVTSILLLIVYLLKSMLGIDLMPGHLGQC